MSPSPLLRTFALCVLSCLVLSPPLLPAGSRLVLSCCLVLYDVILSQRKAVYIYEAIFAQQQADNWDPSDGDVVNLHGYSQAVAKAAIRSGLSRVLQRFLVAGKLVI